MSPINPFCLIHWLIFPSITALLVANRSRESVASPVGLTGISDKTLEMHFKFYEGYVKETNRLNQRIQEFLADGKVGQEEMPAYSELTRRIQRDGFA